MEKKKKVILIVSIIISAILIIAGIICIFAGNNQGEQVQDDGQSKVLSLSNKIKQAQKYKIIFTLNEDNYKSINKNGNQAEIVMADGGVKNTYTIKNNNTYLKVDGKDEEYEYQNNVSLLNDFENNLELFLNKNYIVGTENIQGQDYTYEEYQKNSAFVINFKASIDESNTKTRFYFDGKELKYVKTYIGDIQQLLKVELEF